MHLLTDRQRGDAVVSTAHNQQRIAVAGQHVVAIAAFQRALAQEYLGTQPRGHVAHALNQHIVIQPRGVDVAAHQFVAKAVEGAGQAHAGTLRLALGGTLGRVGVDRGVDQCKPQHPLRRGAQNLLRDEAAK